MYWRFPVDYDALYISSAALVTSETNAVLTVNKQKENLILPKSAQTDHDEMRDITLGDDWCTSNKRFWIRVKDVEMIRKLVSALAQDTRNRQLTEVIIASYLSSHALSLTTQANTRPTTTSAVNTDALKLADEGDNQVAKDAENTSAAGRDEEKIYMDEDKVRTEESTNDTNAMVMEDDSVESPLKDADTKDQKAKLPTDAESMQPVALQYLESKGVPAPRHYVIEKDRVFEEDDVFLDQDEEEDDDSAVDTREKNKYQEFFKFSKSK